MFNNGLSEEITEHYRNISWHQSKHISPAINASVAERIVHTMNVLRAHSLSDIWRSCPDCPFFCKSRMFEMQCIQYNTLPHPTHTRTRTENTHSAYLLCQDIRFVSCARIIGIASRCQCMCVEILILVFPSKRFSLPQCQYLSLSVRSRSAASHHLIIVRGEYMK